MYNQINKSFIFRVNFLPFFLPFPPFLCSGGAGNIKGDWMGLYQRFLKSENFFFWLNHRTKEIQRTLNQLHLQALIESDLLDWMANDDRGVGQAR